MDLIKELVRMPIGDWIAGIAYTVGMSTFVGALILIAHVFGGTI